jgi:branched-chain amino acid transport system permease protein
MNTETARSLPRIVAAPLSILTKDMGRPRFLMIVAAALLAQLVPGMVSETLLLTLGAACIYAIAAIGLNIVFGRGGLLSMAQAALMAVGGYVFILTFPGTLPLLVAVVCAVALSAAISTFTGVLAARVKTHYFILAAFAVGQIILLLITQLRDLTGGAVGKPLGGLVSIAGIDIAGPEPIFRLAAIILAVAWYVGDTFRESREGLALRMTAIDEPLAISSGVAVGRYRILATFLGGAFAGIAGVLLAIHNGFLGPQSFELTTAILLLLIVVVAGRARNGGVVIAAMVLTYLSQGLLDLLAVGNLVYGAGLILLLILAPSGLSGAAAYLRGLASPVRGG